MATEYNCKIIFSSEFECDFIENLQKEIGNLIKTWLVDDELQVTKTTTRIALIKGIRNFFHRTKLSEERKDFPGFKVLPTKLMKKEVLAKRLLDNDCNPPDPKVVMPILLQATKQFEAENVAACASRYLHNKKKEKKQKDPNNLNLKISTEYLMVLKTKNGTYIIPTNHTTSDSSNQIKIFFPDGQNTDEAVKCKLKSLSDLATYDAIIFLGEYYNELKKDEIFCEMIDDDNFTPAAQFCKTMNAQKNEPPIQEFYPLVDPSMKLAIGALSNKHVSILHLLNESFIYLGMNHHNNVKVEYIKYSNSEPQKVHISKDGKSQHQDFKKDRCFEIATVILKRLLS